MPAKIELQRTGFFREMPHGRAADPSLADARKATPSPHEDLRVGANAQRSTAGWVTARDGLHGRVVDRRWVVEMAPPSMLDPVVDGRAADPPRGASASPHGPRRPRGPAGLPSTCRSRCAR